MSFKIGMVGLINSPTGKIVEIQRQLVSEIYAPCTILTEQDNWNEYQYLIVNDFGKPNSLDIIRKRVKKLLDYATYRIGGLVKGPLVDYDIEELLNEMSAPLPIGVILFELPINRATNKLLLGDAHAPSAWPGPNYNLDIRPRQTLASFLDGAEKADWYYFGNEDIRHYLGAQNEPFGTTRDLANRYVRLARKHKAKVTCLLPVESEKRVIAKSEWVNGAPFQGRRELRAALVKMFNEILCESGLEVHQWPAWWYEKPYLYETTIMEKKPSVYVR